MQLRQSVHKLLLVCIPIIGLIVITHFEGRAEKTPDGATTRPAQSSGPAGCVVAGRAASPGITVCLNPGTTWDVQHLDDGQHQVAVLAAPNSDYVRFAWNYWDRIPDSLTGVGIGRIVAHNAYSTLTGFAGSDCGWAIVDADPSRAHGGFPTVDIASGDLAQIALHQRNELNQFSVPLGPHSSWIYDEGVPAFNILAETELMDSTTYPHNAVALGAPGGANDVFHVVGDLGDEDDHLGCPDPVTIPTGNRPNRITSADFNGDGVVDIASSVGSGANVISVIYTDGSPRDDFPIAQAAEKIIAADVNNDGAPDIVCALPPLSQIGVLINNGSGGFGAPSYYTVGTYPIDIFAGTLDSDPYMDLAVANYVSANVSILINNGDGTFGTPVSYTRPDWADPTSITGAPFDLDSDIDLAVMDDDDGYITYMENNGDGTFVHVGGAAGFGPEGRGIVAGDFDNDGDYDIAGAQATDNVLGVFANDGGWPDNPIATGIVVGANPQSLVATDINGDGFLDVATISPIDDDISFVLNNGDGTFQDAFRCPTVTSPTNITVNYLDNDAFPDFAIADWNLNIVSVTNNPTRIRTMVYWRRTGQYPNPWQGPIAIDVENGYNHHVAVDPSSDKLAVIYQSGGRVQYVQSNDNGNDWITSGAWPNTLVELGFTTPIQLPVSGGGCYTGSQCTGEFDLDGTLHIVWPEVCNPNAVAPTFRLMHWSAPTGASVMRNITFTPLAGMGVRDLALSFPQMGIGDGNTICTNGPGDRTNRNYLYVTYEQSGGESIIEQMDFSANNYYNVDIYLQSSDDGGASWSTPYNLTNTKSPGGTCGSERDPSIARTVNDTIHIQYLIDEDAGDAALGQGDWTFNAVMYYRIPGGTDAWALCPDPPPVCSCPHQSDFNADGHRDSVDLNALINAIFFNGPDPQDPNCPATRADFNNDGVPNATDLNLLIAHLFFNGSPPCDPCNPVQSSCS